MVNRDYILRLAEKLGRTLAIVLRLREYNQQEEALLRVDEELFRATGLTSSFLNSLSEETLIQVLSPLDAPTLMQLSGRQCFSRLKARFTRI